MNDVKLACMVAAALSMSACAMSKSSGTATGSGPAASTAGAPAATAPKTPALSPAEQAETEFAQLVARIEGEQGEAQAGWWDNVAERMKRFTARHPKHAPAWYNLGVAQEKLTKTSEAEEAYNRALHEDPTFGAAGENLAALMLRRGAFREAIRVLREIVERDEAAASARVALARSLLSHGSPQEAVRLARAGLARDPKNVLAYCVLADAALASRKRQLVRLLVSQGLKIDNGPDSACLNDALGRVFLAEKQTAKALEQFGMVVQKDGGRILSARFRIAEISLGFKDFTRAINTYKAVTEIEPSNVAAYVNMGVAYKGSGKFAEAEAAYLKAVEVAGDKGSADAHFNLGLLYLRNMDRVADAEVQFKKYLAVGDTRPGDPAYDWLSEIEQRKKMEIEMKRMEAEAERQAEVEKKAAEAEAARKAEEARQAEAEKKRAEEIEQRAKDAAKEEPTGP